MFKSKGAVLGVAVAVVASVLLVAGMGITGTQGAATDGSGTDLPNNVGGGPAFPLTVDTPPQAPVEPPIVVPANPGATTGTNPADAAGTNGANTGGEAGANGGPNALPDAGFGPDSSATTLGSMLVLVALAGVVMLGAGATVVGAGRRK